MRADKHVLLLSNLMLSRTFKQLNSSNSGENIAIAYVVAVTSKTIFYPIKEQNQVIYLFQVGLGPNDSHY